MSRTKCIAICDTKVFRPTYSPAFVSSGRPHSAGGYFLASKDRASFRSRQHGCFVPHYYVRVDFENFQRQVLPHRTKFTARRSTFPSCYKHHGILLRYYRSGPPLDIELTGYERGWKSLKIPFPCCLQRWVAISPHRRPSQSSYKRLVKISHRLHLNTHRIDASTHQAAPQAGKPWDRLLVL